MASSTLPASSAIALHRARFFDYTPSPITALAFSPTPLPAPSDPAAKGKAKALDHAAAHDLGVLVIARENGQVEIWDWVAPEESSMGNWVMQKVCFTMLFGIYTKTATNHLDIAPDIDAARCVTHGFGDPGPSRICPEIIQSP
jgi:hypothetical protein